MPHESHPKALNEFTKDPFILKPSENVAGRNQGIKGHYLRAYDDSGIVVWEPFQGSLRQLKDIDLSGLKNGRSLVFRNGKWVPEEKINSLFQLSDVNTQGIREGQTLTFQKNQWKPSSLPFPEGGQGTLQFNDKGSFKGNRNYLFENDQLVFKNNLQVSTINHYKFPQGTPQPKQILSAEGWIDPIGSENLTARLKQDQKDIVSNTIINFEEIILNPFKVYLINFGLTIASGKVTATIEDTLSNELTPRLIANPSGSFSAIVKVKEKTKIQARIITSENKTRIEEEYTYLTIIQLGTFSNY